MATFCRVHVSAITEAGRAILARRRYKRLLHSIASRQGRIRVQLGRRHRGRTQSSAHHAPGAERRCCSPVSSRTGRIVRSALLNVQGAHTRQALPLNSKSARTRSKSCRATPPPLVGPLTKCFCYFDCCLKRQDRPGLVISSHSLWNSAFLSLATIRRSSRAFSMYCWSVSSPEACLPLSALWMAYRGSTMSPITTPFISAWRVAAAKALSSSVAMSCVFTARVSVTLPIKAVPPSRC